MLAPKLLEWFEWQQFLTRLHIAVDVGWHDPHPMTKPFVTHALIASALAFSLSAAAQTPVLAGAAKWADSAAREINRATIEGDINRFHGARTLLEHALRLYPNDAILLHYRGYEAYREAGLMYALNRQSEIPALMQEASAALQKSDSLKPMPETHALLASTLGSLIGADQSLGPTLGPVIQEENSAAMSTGESNPRVWLLRGISAIYTPPEYGGGLAEAENQLSRAIDLFRIDAPVPPAPSWGRAEAFAWLGQVLQKENKPAAALVAYKKALELEPNYTWVKNGLLPSVKE